MSTSAGWYPDPHAQGQQRYWDGGAWTEHQTAAPPQQPSPLPWTAPPGASASAPSGRPPKQKKPLWRRTWVLVTAGIIVVFMAIGAANGSNAPTMDAAGQNHNNKAAAQSPRGSQSSSQSNAAGTAAKTKDSGHKPKRSSAHKTTQAAAPTPSPTPTPTTQPKVVKASPAPTLAQQEAVQSAEEYISMGTGFSRAGLIQQLSSQYGEGFKLADAVYAADHIRVSWNNQALESAKGYLSMGGFSRAGLIQQLTSQAGEQFTLGQAVYAVNHLGL